MHKVVKNLSNAGIQILWQTGDRDYMKYANMESANIRILPFINNMADAYSVSDLLICRSGALTLAEITICGKTSFINSISLCGRRPPNKKCRFSFQAGAARVLTEKHLNSKKFLHAVMSLVHNQKELDKMSRSSLKLGHPNATKKIVDHIIKAIR